MKKVLVTGVSGYVGQHCAAALLKAGFAVRGSLRNLAKADNVTAGIKKEVDPKGNLEFCALNLLADEGWDKAMEGCDYVLHVASPFIMKAPKDENELIKPAVEGTQRALHAAKRAGVKRIVITSSIVAMLGDINGSMNLNQNSWTNVKAKHATAYLKSKTLAEKSAWEFIDNQEGDEKLELVVINPGPIYGPTLTGNLSGESMTMYAKMIKGQVPMLPRGSVNFSDVRDVASIHVQALENAEANGQRFIVTTEKPYTFQKMALILKSNGYDKVSTKLAPNLLLKILANFNDELKGLMPFLGHTIDADVSPTMKTFNWKPIPIEKMVLDTAESVEKVMKG